MTSNAIYGVDDCMIVPETALAEILVDSNRTTVNLNVRINVYSTMRYNCSVTGGNLLFRW